MSEKGGSILPKIEIVIMLIFFLSFSIWAMSRCNATREKYRMEEAQEESAAGSTLEGTPVVEAPADSTRPPEPPVSAPPEQFGAPLYVTIDGLNMREEPTLKSPVILSLDLYEQVYFMNEVTPFKDSISLGKITAYEPWVKIRHRKGRTGWVYGAGVHYYKMKYPGVQ
jgi:hypothetical protein